jgi:hypothetical protein
LHDGQPLRAFALNEGAQRLAHECCALAQAGELLGLLQQIVVKDEGGAHGMASGFLVPKASMQRVK